VTQAHRPALAAALALLCAAGGARAYRPFNNTDAAVAGKGEFELELGPAGFQRIGGERSLVLPSAVLNLGFLEGWEAVLEGRGLLGTQGGPGERFRLEDTAFSLKHVLREGCLQDKEGLSVATEVGMLLPTVNAEPGVGAQAALIASQRFGLLTLHANAGIIISRAHTLEGWGALIAEGPEPWPVRPVVELLYETQPQQDAAASGLVGAIWKLSEALSLDAAVRLGRSGADTLWEVRAGLTWTVALFSAGEKE
jgi:hypothetical protein